MTKQVQPIIHSMYREVVAIGNIVEEFKSGETTICICDNYCRGTTEKDIHEILHFIVQQTITYIQTKTA